MTKKENISEIRKNFKKYTIWARRWRFCIGDMEVFMPSKGAGESRGDDRKLSWNFAQEI